MTTETTALSAEGEVAPRNRVREEVAYLGDQLGKTIATFAGDEALKLVEELRRLAWERRKGATDATDELKKLIAGLEFEQLRIGIRAFTIFMDLTNMAEDRHRVRVLRQREETAYPEARQESVGAAISLLRGTGAPTDRLQTLIDQLQIELVFTSHPTEAKRQAVRRKLRRLRELMGRFDCHQIPAEEQQTHEQIRDVMAKLWQTDFIRPRRPTVMEEVRRGLSFKPVLWHVVPKLLRDLRDSLAESDENSKPHVGPCVRFGSWIGGDRDGHPGVTPEVTEQTVQWLRDAALKFHADACVELFETLTLSKRQCDYGSELISGLDAACESWPELKELLAVIAPNELCRRWVCMIQWRLQQTELITLQNFQVRGAYGSAAELNQDVTTLLESVEQVPAADLMSTEIQTWLDQIKTFGFHLARLDVRQDSRQYRPVMDEMLQVSGLCDDPEGLDEAARQELLVRTLKQRINIPAHKLSEKALGTIGLFQLLHRVYKAYGRDALGGHVISMTKSASDVLAVLWFWHQTAVDSFLIDENHISTLPIVPLLETIDDLESGPKILGEMLENSVYREYLQEQGDRQMVMLGYSDSTKDGGYISACWSLYKAQRQLVEIADRHNVELTFFHGRGGSLGRGGGPAARAIISLPSGTFQGSLRITEQGEVLAERYDDPQIAYRHLEQLLWSALISCGLPDRINKPEWLEIMQRLNDESLAAYRELVEQPGFVEFFRTATPISEIEQLPIGSRPSRRTGGSSLSDLRAIPWVFSWTQCRSLIPAWYGLGTAVEKLLADQQARQTLQEMYEQWPFFRATIDNAELAATKADLQIAEQYAELAEEGDTVGRLNQMVQDEYRRTCDALLTITGNQELLESVAWLKEAIRVRNRYIDPLNLIQVELLRRIRNCPPEQETELEELRHLARLTINGLAAGMRTSG